MHEMNLRDIWKIRIWTSYQINLSTVNFLRGDNEVTYEDVFIVRGCWLNGLGVNGHNICNLLLNVSPKYIYRYKYMTKIMIV